MTEEDKSPLGRVAKGGEEAIGRFAQDLLEHPVVTSALTTIFETRERATRAQEVAMGALNLPSAADIERLTRRLRAVSQRLEALEDGLDGLQDKIEKIGSLAGLEARLAGMEGALARIEGKLGAADAEAGKHPSSHRAATKAAPAAPGDARGE